MSIMCVNYIKAAKRLGFLGWRFWGVKGLNNAKSPFSDKFFEKLNILFKCAYKKWKLRLLLPSITLNCMRNYDVKIVLTMFQENNIEF